MKDRLSAEGVRRLLTAPYRVFAVDETGSTNADVKRLAEQGEAEGYVLIADRQSQGRGRLNRSFHSPRGTGLYLSVLLRPVGSAADAVFLTVAAAVAAARGIQSAFGIDVGIKWVNDLYYKERKVCGILTEASVNFDSDTLDYAVCGIGFNVFSPPEGFPTELTGIAGSLLDSYDDEARLRLAAAFLNEFYRIQTEDRAAVLDEYRRRSVLIGKTVTSPTGAFEGTAEVLGIDDSAGLVVRLSDGTQRVLSCGEVSVRIYG
ncbi:MAG: biotin--[acetyl-CoA-carboxylase] ligase [Clostridia bacterium]|nr:biotin--[acetyl-CoA-carboxylase] ligase [Clostridia bacterium]